MPRPILFGTALVLAMTTGCGEFGTDLAQYSDLQVDIGSSTDPSSGAEFLKLRLSSSTRSCVVLTSNAHATFNGRKMKTESLGSTESSVFGGVICDEPTFSLPLPTQGTESSTFVIRDSSKTITVEVPDLFARRRLSLVTTGPLHAGDRIQIAWSDPDDELSYLERATLRCDLGGLIGISRGGTPACLDAGTVGARQLEVALPPSLGTGAAELNWKVQPAMPPSAPMADVTVCDGAALCRAAIPYAPEPLEIILSP